MHDTTLVGNLGRKLGEGNLRLFGYLGYVDFLFLFYPLYRFYRYPVLLRRLDGYVGWILLFLSFVMLQPLLVGARNAGLLGRELYGALYPYIGLAGLWLFWLMVFLLSLTLVLDEGWQPALWWERIQSLLERRRASAEAAPERRSRFRRRSGKDRSETTAKKRSFTWPRLSWSSIRSIFRNPFDTEPEEEIEKILSMELDPITTEPAARKRTRTAPTPSPKPAVDHEPEEPFAFDTVEEEEDPLEEEEDPFFEEERFDTPAATEIPDFGEPAPRSEPPAKAAPVQRTKSTARKVGTPAKRSGSNVRIVEELEENSRLLADIERGRREKPRNFRLPPLNFLQKPPKTKHKVNEADIDRKIGELLDKLQRFKIEGDVVRTYSGPLVTTFEFKPAPNVKVSKILGLQDDLAMALSAETIRIQAPIPGRNVVGIEIPNEEFETIYLREILESEIFTQSKSPLTVALGKDIVGKPFVTDLQKLPHLLIAGTTGSGKSVGINAMLLSLLYRNAPENLKLVLIDPKMLEFSIYNDIPHLLTPVITDPKKAIAALANMVKEMERRYRLMSENKVKNIDNYNEKMKREGGEGMPFIVIVIDELADLMMTGGKEVEYSIARLAQMARAAGIHLVVATQRPSVDVVTGLIKANLPARLSYRVGQKIDSKVILDQMGAESLLGRGDALFTPPGAPGVVRIHAPWNTEEEIEKVVDFLKDQAPPEYDTTILEDPAKAAEAAGEGEIEYDPLFEQAKEIVLTDRKTSISYLQRKLQIGYNRSANIIEQLQHAGILSEPNSKGNREILV